MYSWKTPAENAGTEHIRGGELKPNSLNVWDIEKEERLQHSTHTEQIILLCVLFHPSHRRLLTQLEAAKGSRGNTAGDGKPAASAKGPDGVVLYELHSRPEQEKFNESAKVTWTKMFHVGWVSFCDERRKLPPPATTFKLTSRHESPSQGTTGIHLTSVHGVIALNHRMVKVIKTK